MVESPTHDADVAECRTFGRYLSGAEPTEYATRCYLRLLPSAAVPEDANSLLIERALVAAGRVGPLPLRIADAYARFLVPRSLLRRRLILLLAILENSAPAERTFNSGAEQSLPVLAAQLVVTLVASGLCLVAGVIAFGPVHIVSGVRGPNAAAEAART